MKQLGKVTGFSLALAFVFTGVANLLPQVEGEAPSQAAVQVGALTKDSFTALGEEVFKGKGTCTLCHNNMGRAPDLLAENVVQTAASRLQDSRYKGSARDAESYLRESMLNPSAYVVKGYGQKGSDDTKSPMPQVDKAPIQLSSLEVNAVIAFLQAKDGNEVTVPLPSAEAAATGTPAASGATGTKPPAPVKTAQEAIVKFGCSACHTVLGTQSPVGPNLTKVGSRLTPELIRQSIIDPGAVIAEGFPPNVMPADFAERMTAKELELIVQFLAQQK